MKKFPIIIAFLLCLLAMAACHKDKEMDIKEAIVSNEEITVSATQARLSWQVDFVGQYHTGVELSQNENMSDLRRVEATKEEDCFVAVVDSLLVERKYYYRIVVWNKFGSYEQPVGDFTTSKTFSVHVSAEPSSGGTVAGGGTFAEGDTCTVVATANVGYNFVNWTENGTQVSTEAEYPFAVTNNRNLVAHFTSQEYTITAIAEPSEGGTVDGSGGYNNGDECTLTATANEGYEFVDWTKEDGTQVSTNTTYRFMVTESATYIAHFQVKSYTITVSADPAEGGSVEGAGTYEYGQSCTVRATEATGYHFVNWTENGGQVSANEVYTFTVTGDRDLVANFSSEDYIIQVRIDPEEGGTVEGAGGYNYNDECTLKATANAGYDFVNWTKEDGTQVSTETTYRFIVEESATYVAHFQAKVYTITVSAEPIEGGTVSGGGDYHYGDECTLTATANEGYEFVNWTENGVVSAQASYPFTVTGDRTLVANFARETYTISVSAGSGGSAYVGDTPGTLQGTFTYGQPCTVHAVANSGYEFANWTDEGGIVVSSQADYSFDVYGSQNLTANFRQLQYTITVSAGSGGSAYVGDTPGTLQGTFTYNQSCTVHARANNNYIFSGWKENGAVVSSQVDYTFQVTGNRTLEANFTYNPPTPTYTITVSANPSNGGSAHVGSTTGPTTGTYTSGQQCTVYAVANSNYTFTNWTENGQVVQGAGATYTFPVTANRTLVANFITVPTVITTDPVTNIQQTTATGGGNVTNSGGATVTARGVCWSTSSNPTINNSHTTNGTGTGIFTSSITGLTPGTLYHVRAYATNSAGTAYGADVIFTTQQVPTYTISVSASPSNGGSAHVGSTTGPTTGTYTSGQQCTVYAVANSNYTFTNWTENGQVVQGAGATYTFPVTANRTLVANFTYNSIGGHAYVDLGLPSGTLWATCNIGADSPEDYGDYFAWGETQPKDTYNWSNYQYCNGNYNTLTKYCNNSNYGYNGFTDDLTTLLPEDDAATAQWGSGWRMPTDEDWEELLNNTTNISTTLNGVEGKLFTGANSNSIFLPAAGSYNENGPWAVGEHIYYWSNSIDLNCPSAAWVHFFILYNNHYNEYGLDRYHGETVRAVRSSAQK